MKKTNKLNRCANTGQTKTVKPQRHFNETTTHGMLKFNLFATFYQLDWDG